MRKRRCQPVSQVLEQRLQWFQGPHLLSAVGMGTPWDTRLCARRAAPAGTATGRHRRCPTRREPKIPRGVKRVDQRFKSLLEQTGILLQMPALLRMSLIPCHHPWAPRHSHHLPPWLPAVPPLLPQNKERLQGQDEDPVVHPLPGVPTPRAVPSPTCTPEISLVFLRPKHGGTRRRLAPTGPQRHPG